MTLYVDSSVLLKRYVDEHDSELAEQLLRTDPVLATSRLTEIEVRRNPTRLISDTTALDQKRRASATDLDAFALVVVDAATCNEAARVAERTLCRLLDAIHIGAAKRAGSATTPLTFDVRQARAAREVGVSVIGA